MLELAQSLILNEDALNSLSKKKRSVFIYEWLCFLNKVLSAAQKVNEHSIFLFEIGFLRMIFENVNHKLSNNYCDKFKMNLNHQFER